MGKVKLGLHLSHGIDYHEVDQDLTEIMERMKTQFVSVTVEGQTRLYNRDTIALIIPAATVQENTEEPEEEEVVSEEPPPFSGSSNHVAV